MKIMKLRMHNLLLCNNKDALLCDKNNKAIDVIYKE